MLHNVYNCLAMFICLLLGLTGSGKSTTVHFLAGSTLVKQEKFGVKNHIEPIKNEFDPKILTRITTSPLGISR